MTPTRPSGGAVPRTALWYTPVPNVAGVGRHLLDVARAGIPGFRVVFAVPEGPLAEALRESGAAVVTGSFGVADGARSAVRELRALMRRLRPAVLHTHLAFGDLVGMLAVVRMRGADGHRVRLVSTEHGIAGDSTLYQAHRAIAALKLQIHSLRLRRTDRVIAVSASTKRQVLRQWGRGAGVSVIRNGVDPVDAAPPRSGLRVLSLARLSHEKRIDALLEAFALVVREHPEARLSVAGEGPLRAELEARARALGIEDAVAFVGFVDGAEAMRTHDVVAQLSAWENLSYTLLDAVAHGRGVVASDVGGNREIVPARCLVDPDDPAAVAAAVIEQGLSLAERPSPAPGSVSVGQMCERIAGVYEEVLA